VPGGVSSVEKAANSMANGNINSVNPHAMNAVHNLGGPANSNNILRGLNTLSTPTHSKPSIRLTALSNLINAVKKKKLRALVSRTVAPVNQTRLKKYYKKVIKSEILRTPFSRIVKRSLKK